MPRLLLLTALAAFTGVMLITAAPVPPRPRPKHDNFTQTVTMTVTDGLGRKEEKKVTFEMVYVPGGDFTMGDQEYGPAHQVEVSGFWMGKCEVTWDEFDFYRLDEDFPRADDRKAEKLGADAITRPTTPFVDETYEHGRDGHPALSMTHHAAMTYCHWLRQKTKKAYRLPTEAEWEYAARAGRGDSAYWFGDDPKMLGDYAWFKDNSADDDHPRGTTHKAGSKKPNPLGLHDLYGNVAEWTLDQYDPKAYTKRAKNALSLRPVTVPEAKRWAHVARGGSWADRAEKCRSATRRVSDPSWQKWDPCEPKSIWWLTKMDVIGFRVVLAEEEQKELIGLTPLVTKRLEGGSRVGVARQAETPCAVV